MKQQHEKIIRYYELLEQAELHVKIKKDTYNQFYKVFGSVGQQEADTRQAEKVVARIENRIKTLVKELKA